MSNFNENASWRYATKRFDATKQVSDQDLEYLKTAMNLTASSFGLQPYEILIIKDQATKEKLKHVSWDQSQIVDAPYVIVIANKSNFGKELIDQYIDNTISSRGGTKESLTGYADFMKSKMLSLSKEEKTTWSAKQAYLVLGNLMNAAADLKLDTCPMEGFEPEQYNTILGLTERNLNACVIAPIGYRHTEDDLQHAPKVRKTETQLFKTI